MSYHRSAPALVWGIASLLVTLTIPATILAEGENVAPVASLAAPASAPAGTIVVSGVDSFDADGIIVAYAFTFDGLFTVTTSDPEVTIEILEAGEHQISLVVEDDLGASSEPVTAAVVIGPADLATIAVSGPESLAAGTSAEYGVAGSDLYGNVVDLLVASFVFDAPQLAGPTQVCYTEGIVTGCIDVTIVAGPLVALSISGPTIVAAGETVEFALDGVDAFGNAAQLAQASLAWTAPCAPGAYSVEYAERDVSASLDVAVVLGAVDDVDVTPAVYIANVNHAVGWSAAASDRCANALAGTSFAWTTSNGAISAGGVLVPTTPGQARVTATASGVTGGLTLPVSDVLSVKVVYADNTLTLTNGRIDGTATVRFLDGAVVPGADVVVRLRSADPQGLLVDKTASGKTDAQGRFRFVIFGQPAVPATYQVDTDATWNGNAGHKTDRMAHEPVPMTP